MFGAGRPAGASGSKGTFAFGKHKGRSFEEVAREDAGYAEWALRMDSPSGALKDFVEFLKRQGMQAKAPQWKGDESSPNTSRPGAGRAFSSGAPVRTEGLGRLADDLTFVCELIQERHFAVRVERLPGLTHKPGAGSPPARVPQHIWGWLGSLKGAILTVDRRSWAFPLSSYEDVVVSLDSLGAVERVPQWVFQMGAKVERCVGDLDATVQLPDRLLPYQLEGVRFGLSRGGRCLIGDEMGLGKTLQALSLVAQYPDDWPALVVCPSALRWVWKEQAEQWFPDFLPSERVQVIKKGSDSLDPDARLWIISYNLLASDAKNGKFQQRPDGGAHGIVIADESHNIKEWAAARTKALVPLLRKARRCVLLSGTPTRNSADELHPQLCGLVPNLPAKFPEFRARYCLQQQQQMGGRIVYKVVGARNTAELNHLLTSTVMVRRLKKEVLAQLPPKRRQRIPIEVSDSKALTEVRREMKALKDELDGEGGGEAVSSLFLKTAKAKLPAVKEYLLDVLDRSDEKAIIFAHHKLVMDAISELLTKRLAQDALTHIRIDGGTPSAKRGALVKQFQEDPTCRIALLSITACGEGITLTAAGLVIFAELYWVPGAVEQAEARAHRIGTTHNKVVVEFLVMPNSPDEQIYSSLERKKKDTSRVLDGTAESLNAAQQLLLPRKRPAPKAEPAPTDGEVEAEGRGRKRAAVRLATAATPPATPAAVPATQAQFDTPPAVDRAKIDFLLRAMQESQSSMK